MRWFRNLALGAATIALAACGGSAAQAGPPPSAAWALFRVRCAATCTVRYVAVGPAVAHAEGHVILAGP